MNIKNSQILFYFLTLILNSNKTQNPNNDLDCNTDQNESNLLLNEIRKFFTEKTKISGLKLTDEIKNSIKKLFQFEDIMFFERTYKHLTDYIENILFHNSKYLVISTSIEPYQNFLFNDFYANYKNIWLGCKKMTNNEKDRLKDTTTLFQNYIQNRILIFFKNYYLSHVLNYDIYIDKSTDKKHETDISKLCSLFNKNSHETYNLTFETDSLIKINTIEIKVVEQEDSYLFFKVPIDSNIIDFLNNSENYITMKNWKNTIIILESLTEILIIDVLEKTRNKVEFQNKIHYFLFPTRCQFVLKIYESVCRFINIDDKEKLCRYYMYFDEELKVSYSDRVLNESHIYFIQIFRMYNELVDKLRIQKICELFNN